MIAQTSKTQTQHTITRSAIEGVVVIDGRLQMEKADMPTITYEEILMLQALEKQHQDGQKSQLP